MYQVRQEDLPFKGLSHNFVGADRRERPNDHSSVRHW